MDGCGGLTACAGGIQRVAYGERALRSTLAGVARRGLWRFTYKFGWQKVPT
ncbi:hypothetical protein D3C80_1459410 [compost metagenome]